VVHQAWGARLGGGESQRAHIVGWREGSALCGVIVASVLPTLAGLGAMTATFALLLLVGLLLLGQAPRPVARHGGTAHTRLLLPWSVPDFRRLLAVYLLNGIASAVPATLLLFFVRDLLDAQAFEGAFLAGYFIAAALSIPLWLRGVARFGLARCWLASMLLAIAAFGWSALLGAGDVRAFGLICLASGLALGADLTLPGAMLAGIIQRAGHSGSAEGAYMGWWNFAGKLNLALAAGLALPALQAFGYAPGSSDAAALGALALAYALLPCALKLLAAGLLYFGWMRRATARGEG
jgi:Na+/melibiose symporter-like transporter